MHFFLNVYEILKFKKDILMGKKIKGKNQLQFITKFILKTSCMCTYEFIPKIVGTVHQATNGSHDPCPPPSKLADEADIDDAFTKYGKNHPHSEHEDNLSSPESPTNGRILDDLYNVLWER